MSVFFHSEKKSWFVLYTILSLVVHCLLLFFIYQMGAHFKSDVSMDMGTSKRMSVNLVPKPQQKKQTTQNLETIPVVPKPAEKIPEPNKKRTITSENSTRSLELKEKPLVTEPKKLPQGLQRFLPSYNENYLNKLREESAQPPEVTADGGDIPLGTNEEKRLDQPTYAKRFSHQDLSLFQFSQIFKERFGAAWNTQERWLPPQSPLRPGNVVYYKVYINPDGSLNRYENITKARKPEIDYEHLDKIFGEVLPQAFPLPLPGKLVKDTVVSQILTITVVDGNLRMWF